MCTQNYNLTWQQKQSVDLVFKRVLFRRIITFNTQLFVVNAVEWIRSVCTQGQTYANKALPSLSVCASTVSGCFPGCPNNSFFLKNRGKVINLGSNVVIKNNNTSSSNELYLTRFDSYIVTTNLLTEITSRVATLIYVLSREVITAGSYNEEKTWNTTYIYLRKGERPERAVCIKKIAASVLLKMFMNGSEKWHSIDTSLRMTGTPFSSVNKCNHVPKGP